MRSSRLLFSFLFIALIIPSCKNDDPAKNGADLQPVDVRISVIRPSLFTDYIEIAGTVKALDDASISPEEGGIVKAIVTPKGRPVKKGDVILLLKDEVMKASFDAADAQYKMAELNVEKQKGVYEQQGMSELQYKNLVYTRDAAKANADLMRARFERTRIQSPIDGTVDNIVPNVGEFAPPGVPIARVVNVTVLKIQAEVPESYAGSIALGIPAIITIDALPEDTIRGNVSFVGSTVSAANRTLPVEIIVSNHRKNIKPEMVTKVRLVRETRNNSILVNESLIQLVDRDRRIVYVGHNGKAEERQVQIGGRQGNRIEILSGIHAGDSLIVVGYQKLTNGSPIVVSE
jgi:membrane fusion protein (multidrug efflux system)